MNIVSAKLNCGNPQTLAAALYAEYPQMAGESQVISTAGKVRIATRAAVDMVAVEEFVTAYANSLTAQRKETQEAHQAWMDNDHLNKRYYQATVRRQQNAQRQASRLRMK